MIEIQCRTNIDKYKRCDWPTQLPAVPEVGQHMASRDGKRLDIVALTWRYDGVLEVELHRGNGWPCTS